jgi:hypothetical protein
VTFRTFSLGADVLRRPFRRPKKLRAPRSNPRKFEVEASDLEAYVWRHATELRRAAERCKAKGLTAEVLQ